MDTDAQLRKAFAERLRAARRRAGLTSQELADRIGVAQSSIARYESGMSVPRPGPGLLLAQALGMTVDEMLYGTQQQSTGPDPEGSAVVSFAVSPDEYLELVRRAESMGATPDEAAKQIVSVFLGVARR